MAWKMSSRFQPTHPHGVRRRDRVNLRHGRISFNPRTRTGCDSPESRETATATMFQPTHPHGVRLFHCEVRETIVKFQPTHPHGVRRYAPFIIRNSNVSFNPRTRTGCDKAFLSLLTKSPMFQPTHPHGVRQMEAILEVVAPEVSTHAPARGATNTVSALPGHGYVSTHAPARGATLLHQYHC